MLLRRQFAQDVDTDLDLTPMVDVIFQLLTFLLLTYQPTPGDVDVPPARHGIGVEQDEALVLTVLPPLAPGGPAPVSVIDASGRSVALIDPETLRDAVTEGLRAGRRKVVLQADGAVPHGEILRIASTVAEVEGVVLHIGVQEP